MINNNNTETTVGPVNLKKTTGVVLAGGKSKRMGRDKSLAVFNGQPLLVRSVRVLSRLFGETIIVINQGIPGDLRKNLNNAKIIRDKIPYLGPLGGISAALKASAFETVFVAAVDMPFINAQMIEYLAGFVDGGTERAKTDAVIPVTATGYEPLFAFYSKRCFEVIDKKLASGERKVVSIFSSLNIKKVDIEKLGVDEAGVGVDLNKTFININTESDLRGAEEIYESLKGAGN